MRIQMKGRNILAVGIAIGLLFPLFTACSTQKEGQPARDVPMGRYVEQQWELPAPAEYVAGPVVQPDGKVGILLFEEDFTAYYTTLDGKSWQEENPSWISQLADEGRSPVGIHFNNQGTGAVLHQGMRGDDYTYEVGIIQPDGSFQNTEIGQHPKPPSGNNTVIRIQTPFAEAQSEQEETAVMPAQAPPIGEGEASADDLEENTSYFVAAGNADGAEAAYETAGLEETDDDLVTDDELDFFYASGVLMGDDGLVYACSYYSTEAYDPQTGLFVKEYEGFGAAVAGSQLAQIIYPEYTREEIVSVSSVILFGQENSEKQRIVEAGMLSSGNAGSDVLYGGGDGSLYLATAEGIHRLAPGGDTWERLVDGDLTSLSLPSAAPSAMITFGDNEFLILLYNENKPLLMHYAYAADIPSRPDQELIVYTLQESKYLQQAAGTFRQVNPNAVISIYNMLEEGGAATVEDAIRALNTELLAGKGPDLLVLDGMPLDSYLEKGVLADITDIVKPMVEDGALLENAIRPFLQNDKYYAVPTRIGLPTLWGDTDAVAAGGSVASLAEYAAAHQDKRMFHDMRPAVLMERFAPVYQGDWLDGDTVNIEALADFFEEILQLASHNGGTPSLSPEGEEVRVSAMLTGRENTLSDMMSMAVGETELMVNDTQGLQTVMEPNGAMYSRLIGDTIMDSETRASVPDDMVNDVFRMLGNGQEGYFTPQTMIGVNSAGKQQDLAKAFLRSMLSYETQSADLQDGFPVHTEVVEESRDREENVYMSFVQMDDDGITRAIQMTWPSEAVVNAVLDTLYMVDKPIIADSALMQIVMEESDAFFNGSATAQQAAEQVAQRARLRLAE